MHVHSPIDIFLVWVLGSVKKMPKKKGKKIHQTTFYLKSKKFSDSVKNIAKAKK